MKYRKTLLSASIVAALCLAGTAAAGTSGAQTGNGTTGDTGATSQKTTSDQKKAQNLIGITVTGIRNSQALSLSLKKYSDSHVEVVTAEDIGKLPAKNVADTLERLPGVNIASASASEGGFDEADRVSLHGTSPSLTQTLVDGHNIGSGDWFVLSQVQTVGRSVSYSLLPSEIVDKVVVHKSSEASLVEGGAAGSVNIITRKPLDFKKPVTVEASIGGVYADLPGDTKPQFSGLFNWRNDSRTVGFMAQAFYEKRSLQRNGQEVVGGYAQIAPTDPIAVAHPDLAGKYYPNEIGEVYFHQTRVRKGGVIDLQVKPTDNLTLNLNGFLSRLDATNDNNNYMLWTQKFVPSGAGLQPGYTVQGNVLTQASFAPVAGGTAPAGIYDQISRPGASSESRYVTLDADWQATENLDFKGQIGTTHGEGNSPTQNVVETVENVGQGGSWSMNGTGRPIDWTENGVNNSQAGATMTGGWIFGTQDIHVKDKERWGKLDGELDFDDGPLSSLQFGARYADHTRENQTAIAQGPVYSTTWGDISTYPTSTSNFPSDLPSSIGGQAPVGVWQYTDQQLKQIDAEFANRDPQSRFYFNNIFKVNEKDSAAYIQANFFGDRWSGNFGVRYVHTKESINYTSTAPDGLASSVQGPITGSAFGDYYLNTYNHSYGKFLPSFNLKFNLSDSVLARFDASQTITRPDYSALSGTVAADDLTHTGSGGNPALKPLISTNFGASLEWYFAPRGLLSASVYQMQLHNYVDFGTQNRVLKDMQASKGANQAVYANYQISVPTNVDGHVKGVELSWIQPIGKNFGISTNYTYAQGAENGNKPLQGTSKNTANFSAFYENSKFNARIGYTYRSSFFDGVSRTDNYYKNAEGDLSASLGYSFTPWMSVTLDAMNLNNPKLSYYTKGAYGKQPYSRYDNGRQYYVNLRFKF